ncbi:uncharacterized protein ACO6RY_13615 [Pungitius sinensis]
MTGYNAFHAHLTSIMEALTSAAVSEICELVEDSYAVLRVELRRSTADNAALRRKLQQMEGAAARDHRRQLGGLRAPGGGDLPPERRGAEPMKENLQRGGRAPRLEVTAQLTSASKEDSPSGATEKPEDQDVVLIKVEAAKEEKSDHEASGELLLNEDGAAGQLSDDGGPCGLTVHSAEVAMMLWDRSSVVPEHRWTHSAPGSAGAAESVSSDAAIDLESDCKAPSERGSGGRPFLFGSGESPPELRRIGSFPYDANPDLGASWTNQGLPHRSAPSEPSSLLDPQELSRFCRDGRRFVCSFCRKCFTSSRSLETHVRVHTGERPYSCAQCGKRFTQSGHLKTHQSVHTGERPFACQHCGKRFAGKQNLRIHEQKHHAAA